MPGRHRCETTGKRWNHAVWRWRNWRHAHLFIWLEADFDAGGLSRPGIGAIGGDDQPRRQILSVVECQSRRLAV